MGALVIQSSDKNQKLILAFVKKIGSKAVHLKNPEIEDILFGQHIQKEEASKLVSRAEIFKELDKT